MSTFNHIWALLEPKIEYTNLIYRCKELWDSFPIEKQREIYLKIRNKKLEHVFVDYNPLLAIRNNANSLRPKPRQMSFNDYYIKYGTTEEKDGWRMVKPKEGNVFYERN